MKLKSEFTINKKKKDKNKTATDGIDKSKPKKRKRDKTPQEKGKEKQKKTKIFPPPPAKKPNKKKQPISRESSISTISRRRPPRRRSNPLDSEDAGSARSSIRDSSIISSRASTFSDVDSEGRPWKTKKKKDPIVYSCCGFCSLGAGSLLTALIYVVS